VMTGIVPVSAAVVLVTGSGAEVISIDVVEELADVAVIEDVVVCDRAVSAIATKQAVKTSKNEKCMLGL
jgi:hypothetical protein